MNEECAEALRNIARRIERYAANIEIQWDGMKELVAYADMPLQDVLFHAAQDIRAIAEAVDDEAR